MAVILGQLYYLNHVGYKEFVRCGMVSSPKAYYLNHVGYKVRSEVNQMPHFLSII